MSGRRKPRAERIASADNRIHCLSMTDSVCAEAPGGIGNFGPGLDVLGAAVQGLTDRVWAVLDEERPGVHIDRPGHPDLPRDATRHASGIAATEVLRIAGRPGMGVSLRV